MSRLQRFKSAHDDPHAGFEAALAEIRSGAKRGHWIWYVFPQLAGLGTSANARFFALDGESEANAYLQDPELRTRLLTIATAVAERLRAGSPLRSIMGSEIDAKKIVSSLTLFRHVSRRLSATEDHDDYEALATVADEVLTAAAAEGYSPCAHTLVRLRGSR